MSQNQPSQPEQIDELLSLLADRYCRATLAYFQASPDDVVSVEALTQEIQKEDHGGREQIAIQLHHSALPRLEDFGVLDFDARNQTIQYHGHAELEMLLNSVSECFPTATY